MTQAAFFLTHFWHTFFVPEAGPWYGGGIWGNVVAVVPCAVLAGGGTFMWSRTKYWPLNLLHAKLDKILEHHRAHKEHHEWVATQMAEIYQTLHGRAPAKHPHFDIGEKRELDSA